MMHKTGKEQTWTKGVGNTPNRDSTGGPDDTEESGVSAKIINGSAAVVFTESDFRRLGINPKEVTHVRARIMSGAVLLEAENVEG